MAISSFSICPPSTEVESGGTFTVANSLQRPLLRRSSAFTNPNVKWEVCFNATLKGSCAWRSCSYLLRATQNWMLSMKHGPKSIRRPFNARRDWNWKLRTWDIASLETFWPLWCHTGHIFKLEAVDCWAWPWLYSSKLVIICRTIKKWFWLRLTKDLCHWLLHLCQLHFWQRRQQVSCRAATLCLRRQLLKSSSKIQSNVLCGFRSTRWLPFQYEMLLILPGLVGMFFM